MNIAYGIYKALKSRYFTHSPLSLNHVVTFKCNANCGMCGRNQKENDYLNELTLQECFHLLDDAKKAGIISYTMYGGEPLLRKDIPEILGYAKKLGFYVVINTNGYLLQERCTEILPFINSLIVSLDADDEVHDKLRGINGLAEKAIKGIEKCKGKTRISINSVITNQNKASVQGLAELSKRLNVPVFIQPMVVIPGINEYLKLEPDDERNLLNHLLKLKKEKYRILNSYTYINNLLNKSNSHCHAPKIYIRIEGDGSIVFCRKSNWGNIRDRSLTDVFTSIEFKDFCFQMENCSNCSSACTDITKLYDNPLYAFSLLKNYL